MKIGITFLGDIPKISIYGLNGILLSLSGRTEIIVSKDPMDDTLATWFYFFVEKRGTGWVFDYQSNCQYTKQEDIKVIQNILANANHAIAQKIEADLSQEFNALNIMEPYSFSGLYSQMNEHHAPVFTNIDPNQEIEYMRDVLKSSMTPSQIESDEHIKSFILKIPLNIIWVDDTSSKE